MAAGLANGSGFPAAAPAQREPQRHPCIFWIVYPATVGDLPGHAGAIRAWVNAPPGEICGAFPGFPGRSRW